MILADTSVWIDHLRKNNEALAELLQAEKIVCHQFVIGELACGGLRDRETFLALLSALPSLQKVDHHEVLAFIDNHRLMNVGLGLVDVHLLASCLLSGANLWTRDRKLAEAADRLDCNGTPKRN